MAQWRNSSLNFKSSELPTAVLLPCTAFVGVLAQGVLTDFDLRRTVLSARAYDSMLMAVLVSGKQLLAWLEYSLSHAPFYFQTHRLLLGFDRTRAPPCQINMLQVADTPARAL